MVLEARFRKLPRLAVLTRGATSQLITPLITYFRPNHAPLNTPIILATSHSDNVYMFVCFLFVFVFTLFCSSLKVERPRCVLTGNV